MYENLKRREVGSNLDEKSFEESTLVAKKEIEFSYRRDYKKSKTKTKKLDRQRKGETTTLIPDKSNSLNNVLSLLNTRST